MSQLKRSYQTSQVDSDQKETIINSLKGDIFEMKQTQDAYNEITTELKNLQNKYATLEEEKQRNMLTFRQKNDQDGKLIQNLKIDIENTNQMQRQKQIELFEIKTENQQISELNQQKEIELSNFQAEYTRITEHNNRMNTQKESLENQLDSLQQEKKQLQEQLETLQNGNDQKMMQKYELDKNISEQSFQRNMLAKQISYANNQNQALQIEQRSKFEHIEYIKAQTTDAERALKQLERDLIELNQIHEKTQTDATQFQENFTTEQSKGNELQKQLQEQESELRQLVQQLSQVKSENSKQRNENMQLLAVNQQLSQDLEGLKAHILRLVDKNQQFLAEFDVYANEDKKICEIVNRVERIEQLKTQSEDQINISLMRIQDKNLQN